MVSSALIATSPEVLARLAQRRLDGKRLALLASGLVCTLVLLACTHGYVRHQAHGRWLEAQALAKQSRANEERWRVQLAEFQAAHSQARDLQKIAMRTQLALLSHWQALPHVLTDNGYWSSVGWQPAQMHWEGIAANAEGVEHVQRRWREYARLHPGVGEVSLLSATPTEWGGLAFHGLLQWRWPHAP